MKRKRRESALERWAARWARGRGVLTSKLTDPTGVPDRVFWAEGGRPWLIEFKDPGGAVSGLQEYYVAWFHDRGYRVAVIESKAHFLELMGEARDGEPKSNCIHQRYRGDEY